MLMLNSCSSQLSNDRSQDIVNLCTADMATRWLFIATIATCCVATRLGYFTDFENVVSIVPINGNLFSECVHDMNINNVDHYKC